MSTVVDTKNLTKRYREKLAVNALNLDHPGRRGLRFSRPQRRRQDDDDLDAPGPDRTHFRRSLGMRLQSTTSESLEVKKRVGYLPENPGFYDDMSARENLLYMARLTASPKTKRSGAPREVLEQVGLADDGRRLVKEYSRGMKQRLGIAEVLVKKPTAIILDEPTLGIDPDGAIRILELIKNLNHDHGLTVMLSSHQLQQVQQICNRVGIIVKGKLIVQGEMDTLGKGDLQGPPMELSARCERQHRRLRPRSPKHQRRR